MIVLMVLIVIMSIVVSMAIMVKTMIVMAIITIMLILDVIFGDSAATCATAHNLGSKPEPAYHVGHQI